MIESLSPIWQAVAGKAKCIFIHFCTFIVIGTMFTWGVTAAGAGVVFVSDSKNVCVLGFLKSVSPVCSLAKFTGCQFGVLRRSDAGRFILVLASTGSKIVNICYAMTCCLRLSKWQQILNPMGR